MAADLGFSLSLAVDLFEEVGFDVDDDTVVVTAETGLVEPIENRLDVRRLDREVDDRVVLLTTRFVRVIVVDLFVFQRRFDGGNRIFWNRELDEAHNLHSTETHLIVYRQGVGEDRGLFCELYAVLGLGILVVRRRYLRGVVARCDDTLSQLTLHHRYHAIG